MIPIANILKDANTQKYAISQPPKESAHDGRSSGSSPALTSWYPDTIRTGGVVGSQGIQFFE